MALKRTRPQLDRYTGTVYDAVVPAGRELGFILTPTSQQVVFFRTVNQWSAKVRNTRSVLRTRKRMAINM